MLCCRRRPLALASVVFSGLLSSPRLRRDWFALPSDRPRRLVRSTRRPPPRAAAAFRFSAISCANDRDCGVPSPVRCCSVLLDRPPPLVMSARPRTRLLLGRPSMFFVFPRRPLGDRPTELLRRSVAPRPFRATGFLRDLPPMGPSSTAPSAPSSAVREKRPCSSRCGPSARVLPTLRCDRPTVLRAPL